MPKPIDLEGETFSRWTVRGFDEGREGDGAAYWVCECECGTVRSVHSKSLRNGTSRSCGCLRRELMSRGGENHPAWRGGRRVDDQGYVRVYRPDHPAAYADRSIPEHRAVMEEHLGRLLREGETVHHVNGVRDDNRIENLELWSKSHPAGQRVEDKLAWAMEFIEAYG